MIKTKNAEWPDSESISIKREIKPLWGVTEDCFLVDS